MGAKILVADDDSLVRLAIQKILLFFDHEVTAVESGRQVLECVNDEFDVIVLDINMPDMDGFETLERLNRQQVDIPVLFLTGAGSMDYAVKAIHLGAYDFLTKPIADIELFHVKVKQAVEKRHFLLQEKAYKKNLEREVEAKTRELAEKNLLLERYSEHLEQATVQIMSSLQAAMEEKDGYTAGHTRRVTELALLLGQAAGFSGDDITVLRRASQFHDIGKLVIDLSCIQKPGALSPEEWELIKKHPGVGASIIEPLTFMDRERDIIRHHHEKIDGTGYPDGIGGNELDTLTRIITIADSYDAMTSRRNYRKNLTSAEAVGELRRCGGTQFDPELVEIFAGVVLSACSLYKQ
ncbi:response regulator receiver modulated metal dependent phosphohydrolase [Desulfobulbus propionicus DSM 2032]|jgi:response regulator RpfG family c-di-GMP phosphodiesterase|uniref:Response regulator receiver modulated metal dependent phosphohydrolase n=1 Tax=Desulfobulbus propionicus (strain ATCC 33891 / DSM 2032 / VKM B-1956 / 1pr3) TaxID=577650 RepID=A0A7U3YPZ8_DESPD|nr:HD domain-containing phosphohydrolase [Desulfobulbus propionicus]ADW19430.1 response regulator receiver modulated metal dependent phosphohydrolase [Desulfobulbus propionicus DSM 2032]